MLYLESKIENIGRVGTATAKKLKKLGIKNIRDLLFYFPYRYDDFTKIVKIKDLVPGINANIVGTVEMIQNRRGHKRRINITEALINDGTDTLKAIWFNQPFITNTLKPGDTVSLAGKIDDGYNPVIVSPVYEKIKKPPTPLYPSSSADKQGGDIIHTQGFVPIYHLTADLTQKQIRFIISQIISLSKFVEDWLPTEIKEGRKLLDISSAIEKCHFPKNQNDITFARERLAFDEVFLLQLESQLARRQFRKYRSLPIEFKEKETVDFVNSLPFKLTDGQRQSAWEIIKDISRDKPMSRLLEGDVGSGKTLVACLAMYNTALNKKKSVLMVPTEILAKQHYDSVCKLFEGKNIKIGLITRSLKKLNIAASIQYSDSPAVSKKIQNTKYKILNTKNIIQKSEIIIGTHALLQEDIALDDLALVIIDEQHRFGVGQRHHLIQADASVMPHLLSMTATPIPRSLALALYGDLDISVIKEMPKDRKKIFTRLVEENNRAKAYAFIREQINAGRQAFVVCPLIDASDPLRKSVSVASKLEVKSVEEEFIKLDKIIFPDLKIGMLHGRMKSADKEKIMQDFLENKINILVSTSVIEVGVDVPNATIMMIEGAERFGLAQLHQFRGRVGRAEHQSYCFLFTDNNNDKILTRLRALVDNASGFDLAKMDLKFRGPGEFYGTAQKGFPELKIASLFDYQLMKQAKEEAFRIIEIDPSIKKWPPLKNRFDGLQDNIHFE